MKKHSRLFPANPMDIDITIDDDANADNNAAADIYSAILNARGD